VLPNAVTTFFHLQIGFFTTAVHFCWSRLHSNNILYLVIYKFYVFHIQCNRLIIRHLIQQTILTLQCPSYMFSPPHGHLQGGLLQRNTQMMDSVKDVYIFFFYWRYNPLWFVFCSPLAGL